MYTYANPVKFQLRIKHKKSEIILQDVKPFKCSNSQVK